MEWCCAIDGVAVTTFPVEDLDASNAAEVKRGMTPVIDSHSRLVLDLSRLRFRRQLRVGCVHLLPPQAERQGGDLKLCGMSKQVRGVFELVRMHRIFDICATSETHCARSGPPLLSRSAGVRWMRELPGSVSDCHPRCAPSATGPAPHRGKHPSDRGERQAR